MHQSERAARKATILQMATMYTVLGGTLLNVGVTFSSQGSQAIANGSFIGAGMQFSPQVFPEYANSSLLFLSCLLIRTMLRERNGFPL